MYYSLNWFDKILINIDKLELAKNQFITALNKKNFIVVVLFLIMVMSMNLNCQ